jgi:hypothetical protein
MSGPKRRLLRLTVVIAALVAMLAASAASLARWPGTRGTGGGGQWVAAGAAPPDSREVLVAAVGDMACAPKATADVAAQGGDATRCRQQAVSDAILAARPRTLLALGDLQYESGAPTDWEPYDRSYGRLRDITRPVPGNHEYLTPGARGYFEHFKEFAGPANGGYYSFDIGAWHAVALNSQCRQSGGCGADSPQVTWLDEDLRTHARRCVLAFWHIPRFSSGEHGDNDAYRTFWQTLADRRADLILAGHDHAYERLAPMDSAGLADDRAGIRSFVVGTGGRNLRPIRTQRPGSEKAIDNAFGYLELRLRADGYRWRFMSADGTELDRGEDKCH